MKEIELNMSIYDADGQKRILFRKSLSREKDKEFIKQIVDDIAKKGKCELKATVKFKDPVKAIVTLKELKFI